MAKRLDIDIIRESFLKEGYELLTKVYVNSSQKLVYRCPNGHIYYASWRHWRHSNQRCPYCKGRDKYFYGKVKRIFKEHGYQLLESNYKNKLIKMKCICPNGHVIYKSLDSLLRGHKCYKCVKNERLSIDFIKKEFVKEGYTLLTTEYKNNKQKLHYRCPLGHEGVIRFDSWRSGRRCGKCKSLKLSERMSLDKHWNWKGGLSFEPYCSLWTDKEFKEMIKKRDNYKCMNPYCTHKCTKLAIHHIDYNKQNCDPHNLITLCVSCNSRVNYNRDYYKQLFTEIMEGNYMEVLIKKLHKDAKIPTYATEGSVGLDLYAIENYVLRPNDVKCIRSGIVVAPPEGYYFEVFSRSSLACKKQCIILNSVPVLDEDFRGEILIYMKNISNDTVIINKGDRYAQMILKKKIPVIFKEVSELPATSRGAGGFGSTGR